MKPLSVCLQPAGGFTLESFIRGGSAPRFNPSPFCIPFSQKSYPIFVYLLLKKGASLTYLLKNTALLFIPWNEVNEQYYARRLSITRRDVNQKTNIVCPVRVMAGI